MITRGHRRNYSIGIARCIAAMLLFFLSFSFSNAQSLQVKARLDSNTIRIGEQVHLRLSAYYDAGNKNIKVNWPAIADSLTGKIRVVGKSKIDTLITDSMNNGQQGERMVLTITCFDSGYYAIPPFTFLVNGDTGHPFYTEPLMLTVNTVAVDTTKGIKDIKAPISAPWSIYEILPWIGVGAAALVAIIVAIYFIRRRMKNKKPEPVIIKAPPVDPHIKALNALEALPTQKLWQEGKIKEYHSAITDILRVYIDERFGITAPEMITSEIMQALRRTEVVNLPCYRSLQQTLVLSDLVKFAKEKPLPAEHEKSLADAIDFVKSTAEQAPIPVVSGNGVPQQATDENIQHVTPGGNGLS